MTFRVVVLASGTGSLFKALLDAHDDAYDVVALITDRPCDATGIAERAGVPAQQVLPRDHASRSDWDAALAEVIAGYEPDLVVSAGFMRVLGPHTLIRNADRVINTHPALLPAFPGAHAVTEALAYGAKVTGSTVHVVDIGIDTGPVIVQEPVAVLPDDTAAALHERIKIVERRLLVDVVGRIARNGFTVEGRKVTLL